MTSHDVAAHAGVSQATVSLVFSGAPPNRVGAATRERVLASARILGYEPNVVARALVQGRSYTVGLVMPALRDPFFIDAATGAQRVLREQGYAVILAEADESSADRTVAMLRARQIDGLLVNAMGISSIPPASLDGLAVVLIDRAVVAMARHRQRRRRRRPTRRTPPRRSRASPDRVSRAAHRCACVPPSRARFRGRAPQRRNPATLGARVPGSRDRQWRPRRHADTTHRSVQSDGRVLRQRPRRARCAQGVRPGEAARA